MLIEKGDEKAALEGFERAGTYAPESVSVSVLKTSCLKPAEAIKELRVLMAKDPTDYLVRTFLGAFLFEAGEYAEALELTSETIASAGKGHYWHGMSRAGYADLYEKRASAYEKLGFRSEAEADLKKAKAILAH